jgi:hypothetical protein
LTTELDRIVPALGLGVPPHVADDAECFGLIHPLNYVTL